MDHHICTNWSILTSRDSSSTRKALMSKFYFMFMTQDFINNWIGSKIEKVSKQNIISYFAIMICMYMGSYLCLWPFLIHSYINITLCQSIFFSSKFNWCYRYHSSFHICLRFSSGHILYANKDITFNDLDFYLITSLIRFRSTCTRYICAYAYSSEELETIVISKSI